MSIHRVAPDRIYRVGEIILLEPVLRFGVIGYPRRVIAVNKSRLTTEILPNGPYDNEGHDAKIKYAKSVAYIADTASEAFEFWDMSMRVARHAEAIMKQAEAEIKTLKEDLVRQYVTS
jgi:hypothetical protein